MAFGTQPYHHPYCNTPPRTTRKESNCLYLVRPYYTYFRKKKGFPILGKAAPPLAVSTPPELTDEYPCPSHAQNRRADTHTHTSTHTSTQAQAHKHNLVHSSRSRVPLPDIIQCPSEHPGIIRRPWRKARGEAKPVFTSRTCARLAMPSPPHALRPHVCRLRHERSRQRKHAAAQCSLPQQQQQQQPPARRTYFKKLSTQGSASTCRVDSHTREKPLEEPETRANHVPVPL